MSAASSTIQQLRQQISGLQPVPTPSWPFSLWPEGVPQGVLWEISSPMGQGKTQAVMQFMRENPALRCAWLEHTFHLYPPSLASVHSSLLAQTLFVETGDNLFWVGLQVIQSQLFEVVVLSLPSPTPSLSFSEKQLRQMQLLCRRHQCTVILLLDRPLKRGVWPIYLRLQARYLQIPDQLSPTHKIGLSTLKMG